MKNSNEWNVTRIFARKGTLMWHGDRIETVVIYRLHRYLTHKSPNKYDSIVVQPEIYQSFYQRDTSINSVHIPFLSHFIMSFFFLNFSDLYGGIAYE